MPSPRVPALVRASHPVPSLVVTAATGGMASAFDGSLPRTLLVMAAVGAGQLSIGWSNDLLDSRRDTTSARTDKPVATGELAPFVLQVALAISVLLTVLLSLACGLLAGVVHLLAVGCGWAYNLGLKSSLVSPLPYAAAFGMLPHIASLTVPPGVWAPAWLSVTAALVGVAAHLLNALPDLADDAATGVRGLPHRLGAPGSRWAAAVVLLAGVAVAVSGAGLSGVVLAVVAGLVALAIVVIAVGRGSRPFLALAALALGLVVIVGHRLAG